jgi:DNA-binding beta-propeller fold protein YncE
LKPSRFDVLTWGTRALLALGLAAALLAPARRAPAGPVGPLHEGSVLEARLLANGVGFLGPADLFAVPSPPPVAADTHRVYVANESSDMVSRVAFVPDRGAWVEGEIPVGVMPGDIDGAHGITVSPDGRHWYVTIAHGTPYGSVWQFHAGPDTLVGRSDLGRFPATMGVTPDGRMLLTANFNLHGDMVPSSVSVVFTPQMMEVAKVETCLMPHGSRVDASGSHQYSVCMHSDQLVELDLAALAVSARYLVTPGHEGSLGLEDEPGAVKHPGAAPSRSDAAPSEPGGAMGPAEHAGVSMDGTGTPASVSAAMPPAGAQPCSPTWVEPGQAAYADRVVYVACNKNAEVLEVDVRAWEVRRRFATGRAPYNLEATTDGRLLVATLKGEQAVAVIDLERGEEIARLSTSQPVTHGVVASPDGRYAFVTNEAVGAVPGTLDVFDLVALERVATVDLGFQSGGIDYWGGPLP